VVHCAAGELSGLREEGKTVFRPRRARLWQAGLALVVGARLMTDRLLWQPGLTEGNVRRLRPGQRAAHLSQLKHEGLITDWPVRRIGAGTEWAGQIDEPLNAACVILPLLRADSLASRYCYDIERKREGTAGDG
jgi:hypothetical protein